MEKIIQIKINNINLKLDEWSKVSLGDVSNYHRYVLPIDNINFVGLCYKYKDGTLIWQPVFFGPEISALYKIYFSVYKSPKPCVIYGQEIYCLSEFDNIFYENEINKGLEHIDSFLSKIDVYSLYI